MSTIFEKGHALLIGVSDQKNPSQAVPLPVTANDVAALKEILVDPEKCGYDPEKVKVLIGEEANRGKIIEQLVELVNLIGDDPEATAIVYFSGHGYHQTTDDKFYLVPYDFNSALIKFTAIENQDFTDILAQIPAKKMLLMLDCCHAGHTEAGLAVPDGIAVPEGFRLPEGFSPSPGIPGVFLDNIDPKGIGEGEDQGSNPPGSKPIVGQNGIPMTADEIAAVVKGIGEGEDQGSNPPGSKPILGPDNTPLKIDRPTTRAVMVSSRGSELSYIHKDVGLSVFTYHIIEALTGHGVSGGEDGLIDVFEMMTHVMNHVPTTTASLFNGKTQTPISRFDGVDSFPISKLLGGEAVPEGGAPEMEKVLEELAPSIEQNITGDGIGVAGVVGPVNINVNKTDNSITNNATGPGSIAGGSGNENNPIIIEGDVGDGNAIGQGNTVDNSTTTITFSESGGISDHFAQVQEHIDTHPKLDEEKKAETKETVAEIEGAIEEAAGGAEPDSGMFMLWLGKLASLAPLAPDILDGVASIIQDPKHAVADGIRILANALRPRT